MVYCQFYPKFSQHKINQKIVWRGRFYMNKRWKAYPALVYLLTALIIMLDNLCPDARAVNLVKFFTMLWLFFVSLFCRKKYREQVILGIAVFLALLGVFFLNICNIFYTAMYGKAGVFGAMSFFLAYLVLLHAFMRGSRAGRGGIFAAVLVLSLALPVSLAVLPHVGQELIGGVALFALVLCFMAWSAICTIFRGHYSPGAARSLALAGYLILISDSGVALAQFHPAFAGHFTPWLQNIIWGTYIPAWALIVGVVRRDGFSPR